VTLTNGTDVSR